MAQGDGKWQKDAADQNFDYMFKLLIIGNSSVGNTSFLFRYADDSFTSAFVSTVGIDFKVKTVFRNDKRVKLQIWVINLFSNTILILINNLNENFHEGYGRPRTLSYHHNCLLQRRYGLHFNVRYNQRRVF